MSDVPTPSHALDLYLLRLIRDNPRARALELSRLAKVARATVASRLQRLESAGIITGYGPDVDLTAAGYPVHAFVFLEIAQGALEMVAEELAAIPGILEAYATTGTHDVLCRVAARSHQDLQETLLALNRAVTVVRSTSTIVLSTVVPSRILPLLASGRRSGPSRAPAYRPDSPS